MSDLTPIEGHVRAGEVLDPEAALVIRGWPLTVDGLLRNADATRRRYSRAGRPFVAVSAEVTVAGWDVDAILSGPRLRTRRSYAAVPVARVVEAGFGLLATFGAPHYSVVLASYTEAAAQHLIEVLGEVKVNPHHVRREL
jgi:hypothetical protein